MIMERIHFDKLSLKKIVFLQTLKKNYIMHLTQLHISEVCLMQYIELMMLCFDDAML